MTPYRRLARVAWMAGLTWTASVARAEVNVGVDAASRHAWGENIGWVNVGPSNGGVTVHFDAEAGWLSGLAWGENIGWIKMGNDAGGPYHDSSSNDWGVAMNATGRLSGCAWGENVGWINFDHAHCDARVDLATGEFSGHAWGENIGWLKFRGTAPSYGVRTRAFDEQANGTPNWWLSLYGIEDENEVGVKGIPAWQDYVSDTNPTNPASLLRIESVTAVPGGIAVSFWPASTRRYYTLIRRESLADGTWIVVAGQDGVSGAGGGQALYDAGAPRMMFYGVYVSLSP